MLLILVALLMNMFASQLSPRRESRQTQRGVLMYAKMVGSHVPRSVLISAPGAHARQASAKKHPMRYTGSGSDGMTDTSLVRA